MSVKKYGIYLGYPPTVDLRAEGLGRHLAEFLKGTHGRNDVHFVVACPSWMRSNLYQLCEACNIPFDALEIISPSSKPLLLSAYQKYTSLKSKSRTARKKNSLRARFRQFREHLAVNIESRLVGTRSVPLAAVLGILFAVILFTRLLAHQLGDGFLLVRKVIKKIGRVFSGNRVSRPRSLNSETGPHTLEKDSLIVRLYRLMEESEANLMRRLIEARTDISAWYSPTAFWPHFNKISAPRLMCVPDVVLTDFPTGFATAAGNRLLENFRFVENAIHGGEHFVTYSNITKWHTLVNRYGADPATVFVVPHGANRLDDLVSVSGFPDNEAATDTHCRNLFKSALQKAVNNVYDNVSLSSKVRFIFYASQFRPNKNILSLLRAYEYLVKRRFVGHKLILTGKPLDVSEIRRFVIDRNLENDVLCLHGLSEEELAACYRLADLAVNPSLSEGGCPFTFAEALSVGTPAMMARIPVTEEVIVDPALQELMLFDPYDWTDIAKKIEWGLNNIELLRLKQQPFYEQIAQRTWRCVVDEYVDILDRISLQRSPAPCKRQKVC